MTEISTVRGRRTSKNQQLPPEVTKRNAGKTSRSMPVWLRRNAGFVSYPGFFCQFYYFYSSGASYSLETVRWTKENTGVCIALLLVMFTA